MNTKLDTTKDIDRLAELTSRYARYSRSAGGLSLVIGGMLVLIAFVAGAVVPLTPAMRYALAATPLLWLLSKELLRAFYYQRHGGVGERLSPREQRLHRWMVIYLAAVSLLIIVALWLSGAEMWRLPALAYLVVVVALPVVAARCFWSVGDFLVGVLLFCQAAVVLIGSHYPAYWIIYAASCAGIAAVTGVREHRDYRQLRQQLGLGSGA